LVGILIFVSLVAAGLVPLLMFFKVKIRTIRILSLLLGLFAVTHGLYHLSAGFGNELFSDLVFEPVSVSILVAFGLYYSKKGIV